MVGTWIKGTQDLSVQLYLKSTVISKSKVFIRIKVQRSLYGDNFHNEMSGKMQCNCSKAIKFPKTTTKMDFPLQVEDDQRSTSDSPLLSGGHLLCLQHCLLYLCCL